MAGGVLLVIQVTQMLHEGVVLAVTQHTAMPSILDEEKNGYKGIRFSRIVSTEVLTQPSSPSRPVHTETICAIVKGWTCQGSLIWHQHEVTREQRPIRALIVYITQNPAQKYAQSTTFGRAICLG